MADQVLLGMFDGELRLRVSKPGLDVMSTALTDEQLVYDSSWKEIIGVHAAGYNENLFYGAAGQATVSFPDLGFQPIVIAWINGSIITGAKRVYTPIYTWSANTYMKMNFTSSTGSAPTTYLVFNKPIKFADPGEGPGAGSLSLGNQPISGRPPGLYVARRGLDVDYCTDAQLTLSTLKNNLQISESNWQSGTLPSTNYVDLPFSTSGYYPDYPPIIVRLNRPFNPLNVMYWWTGASNFVIRLYADNSVIGAATLAWSIIDYDPSYVPGYDASPTDRVLLSSTGLRISKKDIPVLSASDSQLLLNTSRSMLHVKKRLDRVFPAAGPYSIEMGTDFATTLPPISFTTYETGTRETLVSIGVSRIAGTFPNISTLGAFGNAWGAAIGTGMGGAHFYSAVVDHS